MKNAFMKSLIDLGNKDSRIILISVDQSTGFDDELKSSMRERFIFEPISEANVIGMASGLAAEGYVPFIFNHAAFNTRRCYEQIMLDASLQDRPIRLIGMGAGLATSHLGPTHTAIDDIALMRAIPGMTILAPCDANEITHLVPQMIDWPESIYIRLAKYGEPRYGTVIDEQYTSLSKVGKALRIPSKNEKTEGDVLLITCGALTPIALEVSEILAAESITVSILHMTTVKPIDTSMFLEAVRGVSFVFTLEEHSRIGGLGSACLELLNDAMEPGENPPIVRVGLEDRFIFKYGDQKSLFEEYGLMPEQIVKQIIERMSDRLNSRQATDSLK